MSSYRTLCLYVKVKTGRYGSGHNLSEVIKHSIEDNDFYSKWDREKGNLHMEVGGSYCHWPYYPENYWPTMPDPSSQNQHVNIQTLSFCKRDSYGKHI